MNKQTNVAPSRRQVIAGVNFFLASLQLPAWAQPTLETTPDAFRTLRISPVQGGAVPERAPQPGIWGYHGMIPGPTLRLRRGEELRIRLVNGMEEPTMVHWHGVRLPNAMDGAPPLTQEPVKGGASFDYRFMPPDAGTFWYHATPAQTARGLAGLLIVEETEPVEIARDHALIFQNAAANSESLVSVNGTSGLEFPAPAPGRTRLRLVNAGAHLIRIQLGEASPEALRAWVMAIDGQPAEPFLARGNRISLAPGNRADMFVETTLAPGTMVPIIVEPRREFAPLAHLVIDGPARSTSFADPKPLPANPLPQRLDLARAQRVTVPLESVAAAVPPARPLFSVRRGRVVVLALTNRSDFAQVVHLHGHSARLLDRLDDGWKPFWVDTLPIEPRATERIAFLADNPGKWAIDHRALEHDGAGIVRWFEVT